MTYRPFLENTSIAPLINFRLIFGALAFLGSVRFLMKGWVNELYIEPQFFFTYYGFEWVEPLPGNWMYLPFILMAIAGLGIFLGAFYRISSIVYFLSFIYVELLDKTNYLNHYYFMRLIALLMIFMPANKRFSLDTKLGFTNAVKTIPKVYIHLLLFQISCVYFFAGIAKLNSDWLLNAEPMFTWLQSHRDMPFFGPLLAQKWLAYTFSWIGCFYDLFIVGFLILAQTRKFAYFFVIAFHCLTSLLFPIGIFPIVMICLTLLFFSSKWHSKVLLQIENWLKVQSISLAHLSPLENWKRNAIIAFVAIQCFVPMRYLLYPGNLFWNEEGFRFSWRVMLMHKEGLATFYIHDPKTNGEIEIINSDYLTKRQEEQMSTQPDMIIQYAHHLHGQFQDTLLHFGKQTFHIQNPRVHATVFVSLNSRNAQKMIDKKINLAEKKYDLQHRPWLEPFEK
jgi:hypothetical protein